MMTSNQLGDIPYMEGLGFGYGFGVRTTTPEDGSEGDRPADQVAAPMPASRLPGEMSEEEAQQLLDALSSEEAAFQAPALMNGRGRPGSLQTKRDWYAATVWNSDTTQNESKR